MKTCIIALLAVLVVQGEAFPFPGFDLETRVAKSNVFAFPGSGIQARAGTKSTFPADTDFYCTACNKAGGANDAYKVLFKFGMGNNVEESPVIYGYDSLLIANGAFEISKYCLVASSATPKRVTSADGSVTRFTPSSSKEYFAVEGPLPYYDLDVTDGFNNLENEIYTSGLLGRANLNEPMIYFTNPPAKAMYLAFLD